MCSGVTPTGLAGRTRPSMRSATASAITSTAYISIPLGRWGPCCSTLPAARMTSGFFLNWAAISGCVSSTKYRLGNGAPLCQAFARRFHHIRDPGIAAVVLNRAQGGIDHGHGDIAVIRAEFAGFAAAAAFREHLQLGAEHVTRRHLQLLALAIAIFSTLDVKGGGKVQHIGRVPSAEINLVVHEPLGTEHAHREYPWRSPARA